MPESFCRESWTRLENMTCGCEPLRSDRENATEDFYITVSAIIVPAGESLSAGCQAAAGGGDGLPADLFGRSVAGQSQSSCPLFGVRGPPPDCGSAVGSFPGTGCRRRRNGKASGDRGYSGCGRLSFGADRKRAHRKGAPVSDSARRPLRYAHFTSAKSMRWGSLSFLGKMRMARSNEPVDSGVKRVE